jgi:hypothetical protein
MIFADPMLWRLVWKEYRAQRGFWLAIAGTAVVLTIVLMCLLDKSSMYAVPWGIALTLPMESSKTPCVDGYVTISAASRSLCASAFFLKSSTSMFPSLVLATTRTRMPAMTALAGLVPCADAGISTTSRCVSPRSRWYRRITISPANSPCAPEFGCRDTPAKPVIAASIASSSRKICW